MKVSNVSSVLRMLFGIWLMIEVRINIVARPMGGKYIDQRQGDQCKGSEGNDFSPNTGKYPEML